MNRHQQRNALPFERIGEPWTYGYRHERDNGSRVEVIRHYAGDWHIYLIDSRGRFSPNPTESFTYAAAMSAAQRFARELRGTTDETDEARRVAA